MLIKNTRENMQIYNAASSMALEDMYASKDIIGELLKVSRGEKTSDELRSELISKYSEN